MPDIAKPPRILKGQIIREDENGYVCLDDIHEMSAQPSSRAPRHWRSTVPAKRLAQRLSEIVRIPDNSEHADFPGVIYARRGRHGATFAHAILAAAYAGYLDSDLEIEIRRTWLRVRAGDAELADEILSRASKEDNEWVV